MIHIPVLQKEVIQYLAPKPNENFIDATIGQGGHTAAILKENEPNGKVLGIDRDPKIIKYLTPDVKYLAGKRLILVCGNFANLKKIIKEYSFNSVKGILFDLGMSSWHLEESGRGFSFRREEPLDMRFNPKSRLQAEDIVNTWPEKEIERILKEYGEERFSRRIAKEIIETRKKNPIKSTFQLIELIKRATPSWYQKKRKHFATKTFQALRITVNDELKNLREGLSEALDILEKDGKLVVISFHSLEDRIVKNFLKEKNKEGFLEIKTKKPIKPSFEEIKTNKRSRSAKLRAAVKI